MMYVAFVIIGALGIVACVLGLSQTEKLEKAQCRLSVLEKENQWLRQDTEYYLNILEEEYCEKMKGEV